MPRKHHRVYFVECQDYIKIGSTLQTVRQRLGYMQSGNPFLIEGLGKIECDCPRKTNRKGAKCEKEAEIQSMFEHLKVERRRSEWFHASEELRAYIHKNAEPYEPNPEYA